MSSPDFLDKDKIARSFSRSAGTYDKYSSLQKSLAKELVTITKSLKMKPQTILDIGTGTGEAAFQLAEIFPDAKITGIDIAPGMIEIARTKNTSPNITFQVGDAEKINLGSSSFDLVVSTSTLHWVSDLRKAFNEARRVTKSNGLFVFETYGPDTLIEMRGAFMLKVDPNADYLHYYESPESIKKMLASSGLKIVEISSKNLKQLYTNTRELFQTMKGIGAMNASIHLPKGMKSRAKIEELIKYYESTFRQADCIFATYQVIHAVCSKE